MATCSHITSASPSDNGNSGKGNVRGTILLPTAKTALPLVNWDFHDLFTQPLTKFAHAEPNLLPQGISSNAEALANQQNMPSLSAQLSH